MAVWRQEKPLERLAYMQPNVRTMLDELLWWINALNALNALNAASESEAVVGPSTSSRIIHTSHLLQRSAMSMQAKSFRIDAGPFTRPLAGRAVIAGLIGGIIIDLFLILTRVVPFPGVYQFIASTLVDKAAFTSASYIWLGVAMHFVISIVWALIYTYVANAAHALHRWLLSGLIFGVVVSIGMQIVQMIMGIAQPISASVIIIDLFAHVLFFGLPIAWYLSLPYRRTGATGPV